MNISLLISRSISFTVISSALMVGERAIAGDYRVSAAASLIRQKTTVPILLPSEDVIERNKFNPDETIYANVQRASEYSEYTVEFNNQPGNVGRVAFRFSIKAKRGENIEQSTSAQGSKFQNAKLIDGSNAVVMTQCGAGCWSRVQWKLNGVLYEVWSKTRTPETALAIANSAVKAGDRSKPSVKSADNRSPQIDGQTGAVNLGGSSYFSWGLLKSGSRDNNQPQIIMGYACQTQNQLQGISKRASATRYVIKRGRGTDDWWLESLGGVVVKPTDSGYVPEKVAGTSGNELKPYVTDSSSGWLKRDMDVDGLGSACINGGMPSALSYIQASISNEPIATKPIEQLQPIAPGGSYAYPSPEEFAQFKKGLKSSPVTLSAADLKARQDFQAEWKKKNRAIAPYVGAWKTADNQDVYVFPSKVAGRVCVLRSKNGQLSPDLGVSMTTDMRYDGNNGLFKVDIPEVVAGRSGKTQPLSALYGAIGSPDVSSVKGELEQAQCISELPKGGAIVAKKPVLKITEPKKASTNIGTLSADVTPKSTESPKPAIVAKEDPVVKPKPPLKIELFQIELSINGKTTKSFTDEQWKAFNIAARNWEKIISRDKDQSGQLRIIVTKDETQFSGEESWTLESGNKIRARVFEIDQSVNSRTNYPDIEVDNIFGRDYHNRITWNKELIDGFFSPLRPILPIGKGYRTNLIAIMMHEIGHVLGLNHTKEPKFSNSLMCSPEKMKCANGSAGNRGKESLTEDMIKELEGLGYQVDRQAVNELTWDWWF